MTTNRNDQHPDLDERSLQLRRIIVRMLEGGGRGHVGSALSLVEILRVLYDDVLQYDPHNPNWLDRDRFILSKGQGCLALYAVLADKGFFPDSELDRFCHSEGLLGGHPEIRVPGIEASTGSLGHGLAIGIGFALNAKYENSDYRTFVAIGDGESNEGSIWEGAMCASKHGLSNLTVLVDYNKQQSYGSTYEVQDLEPVGDKWRAFGFGVAEVDGHDVDQIRSVLANLPVEQGKPTTVVCHTVKGKGIDYVEGNLDWHHKNRLSDDDISALKLALEAG
jgi:transketolase